MAKRTAGAVCAVLAALLLCGVCAGAVTQSQIDALAEERDNIRTRQADIQEQIDALETERASVLERKAALDAQAVLNVRDIALLDGQIAVYARMIADQESAVERAAAAEALQLARYKARVRVMEESKPWTYLSVLLKAESLTELLSRWSDVGDILRRDKTMRAEYEAARVRAEETKGEYERLLARQEETRTELLAERADLERQTALAGALIRQLEDDAGAYIAAYEEKEREEAALQARIDGMVAELRAQEAAERLAREAYEADSAAYTWPCPSSTRISSKFGYHMDPVFGTEKYHAGVDIAAAYGSAIVAAAGGTAGICGYSPTYGYYCVLCHSGGVSTLYAHMNAPPLLSEGETAAAGQTLGYVGATGWAAEPGLRFELRVDGNCVDPLDEFTDMYFTFAA